LAERIAYNQLSIGELVAGVIIWTPAIGDLSILLLPLQTTRKFGGFYEGSLLLETGRILASVGGTATGKGEFGRLLQIYVFGDPARYMASTALLILRGMRATGGFLVLWGWLALPVLLRRLNSGRDLGPFLLAAGPLIGLVVVQSLVTSNLSWMNLPLVFAYAYAIAAVTGGLELPFRLRWQQERSIQASS
jgi:hypothetical protein